MHSSILIVEDNQDIREGLQAVLEIMGYEVATAANGREALETLTRIEPPGLILLDLMMPVMNGEEFRSKQLADPKLSQVPVVLISASSTVREKAAALGAAHAMIKPISIEALSKIAEKFCRAA
jgi:CheY-like chemotaxis protein